MVQAIVYCDKCTRMIPRSEIVSGEAVATEGFSICATCLTSLTPQQRATLTRRAHGQSGEPAGPKKLRGPTMAMRAAAQVIAQKRKPRGGTRTMKAVGEAATRKPREGTRTMRAVTPGATRKSSQRKALGAKVRSSDRLSSQAGAESKSFPTAALVVLGAGVLAGIAAALLLGGQPEEPVGAGGVAREAVGPPPAAPQPVSVPAPPPAPVAAGPSEPAVPASERLAQIGKMIDPTFGQYREAVEALEAFPRLYPGSPEATEAAALLEKAKADHARFADARLEALRATAAGHVAQGRPEDAIALLRYTGSRFEGTEWYQERGESEIASAIEEIERKREGDKGQAPAAPAGPAAAEAPPADVTDGLVGHWKLDETSGKKAADSSGGGNDGVVHGAAWTAGGRIGGAPKFDGANDKIDVPYSAALNPDRFSFTLWAKPDSGTEHRSPLTSRTDSPASGYMLYENPEGAWSFWIGSGTDWVKLDGPAVKDGRWQHVACTYDGTTMRMYVDGAAVCSADSALSKNTSRPLRIGAGGTEGEGAFFFPGTLDDVRVYNRALAAEEVSLLAGRSKYASGLLGEYFNNKDLDPAGIALRRVDEKIEFDWQAGSPAPEVGPDGFSVRWSGELNVPAAGRYEFHVRHDDGVRLKVGDKMLMDKFVETREEGTVAAELEPGWVPIAVEFVEYGGMAEMILKWSGPGIDLATIPPAALRTQGAKAEAVAAAAPVPTEDFGLPGVWVEAEKGSGHRYREDEPRASGGKHISRFEQPGHKVALIFHLVKKMPRACVYLRYSRKRPEKGPLDVYLGPPGDGGTDTKGTRKLRQMSLHPTKAWNTYRWATVWAGKLAAGTHRVIFACPAKEGAGNLDVAGLVPATYHGKWSPPNYADGGRLLGAAYVAKVADSEQKRLELLVEATARPDRQGYSLGLGVLRGLAERYDKAKIREQKISAVGGPVVASARFDTELRRELRTRPGYRYPRKVHVQGESVSAPAAHEAFERHLKREKPELVRICFDVTNLPDYDKDKKKRAQNIASLKTELARYVDQAAERGAIPVLFTVPGYVDPGDRKKYVVRDYNRMVLGLAGEKQVPCVDAWRILNADHLKRTEYFDTAGRLRPGAFEAMTGPFLRLYFILERWVMGRERPFAGVWEAPKKGAPGAATSTAAAAGPKIGQNVIVNGGFEDIEERADGSRFATAWRPHQWGEPEAQYSVRIGSANPRDGERSLVLRSFGGGARPGAFITLSLAAGKYELSYWACAAVDETARIGGLLGEVELKTRTVGGDWKQYKETVEITIDPWLRPRPKQVHGSLKLWLESEGRAWFDDVELKGVR